MNTFYSTRATGFVLFCVQSLSHSPVKIVVEELLQKAIPAFPLALHCWGLFLPKYSSSVPTSLQPYFLYLKED